jgi:hypothetical protein
MKHTGKTLSCRDTTWLVCGARDTPLDDEQRRLLDAHIAACPSCQVASRQFAALFAQLDTLFARGPDENIS